MDRLSLEPYAARLAWRVAGPLPPESWQALLAALLEELGRACTEGEPRLIGHIKGLALLPGGGYLRGSVISPHYPADVELAAAGAESCAGLEMDLNVLVYGLPWAEAQRIVQGTGLGLARQWGAALEVQAAGDPHPHE